jgi:hypothetical protein
MPSCADCKGAKEFYYNNNNYYYYSEGYTYDFCFLAAGAGGNGAVL